MKYARNIIITVILIVGVVLYFLYRNSQVKNASTENAVKVDTSTFLLTVFLKHEESKTLDEIQKKLKETGFYKKFPPPGIEIESWKVVMGIGQVVVLKVPVTRLREVNVALEKTAWGSYKTEFYPTYDFMPVYRQIKDTVDNQIRDSVK
jgi:hypothetical protein